MEARVLGPLQVSGPGGTRVNLASQPQRRLMSMLLMRANTVVPADALEDHLGLTSGALRTSVSRLRKLIGADALVTEPPGYELRTSHIDALRLEHLLARAQTGGPSTARAALTEAIGLWRGDAYAEFAHEDWAQVEVTRLTELRIAALEELAELLVDAGERTNAITMLEPVIDAHPYRDRLRALLMRALAESGRRTEALRHFQDYRKLLVEEVGTEPSPALVALDRAIVARSEGDTDALPASEPPPADRVSRPGFRSSKVFLFTDIVGSTRLWALHTDAMEVDLAHHDRLLRAALDAHGGTAFSAAGDSFAAVFDEVDDAVAAAVAAQTSLSEATWDLADGLRVRMAVHLGDAERRGDGWYGPPLNETARMMAVGHGGQILASESVAARMTGMRLVDLGEHHLRDLDGARRLFQVTAPSLEADFPPLRSMRGYLTTLPAQRTSFVGRAELLVELHDLVAANPLVTLLGPGGVGKTRVAIEAAGSELPHFPDGVFFVDLTTATSDGEVAAAVLSGIELSVPPGAAPELHLADHLAERTALVLVDNCEHVLERTAVVVDDLLRAAPGLRVLATSREPLGAEGERCVLVPPLDVDGPASTAVRLFADRALAADSSVELDEHALDTVAEITRRLDGMPLAIELAAARLRTLSPAQILGHLDERFRLLRAGHRSVVPRQQTLEAAIDWSYELLDDDERWSFRRLSICAGPFTLPIVGGLLDLDELDAAERLESLVAKSLVTPIRRGGSRRGYRLLESLRAYGLQKLADADEIPSARAALERALLPPPAHADDWLWIANDYMSDDTDVLEDTTRRDAARHAQDEGRLDTAAFIYCSCAFRDDPGTLENLMHLVGPLAARKGELGPLAWRAANAAEVVLARVTRRYDVCFEAAARMAAALPRDDPARPWFESWRCALTMAVAPEVGLATVDDVIAEAMHHARPGHDWVVASMFASKATGLALLPQLPEALAAAEQAVAWSDAGSGAHDQAVAALLWLLVLTDGAPSALVQAAQASQDQAQGKAMLSAAPAALCRDAPSETRAAELVRLARLRPLGDVATPYLLAFALLAVERGELDRARELAAVVEIYDSSTHIAVTHLLARLEAWSEATWKEQRDATIARCLSPEHEAIAARGPEVLDDELRRWSPTGA